MLRPAQPFSLLWSDNARHWQVNVPCADGVIVECRDDPISALYAALVPYSFRGLIPMIEDHVTQSIRQAMTQGGGRMLILARDGSRWQATLKRADGVTFDVVTDPDPIEAILRVAEMPSGDAARGPTIYDVTAERLTYDTSRSLLAPLAKWERESPLPLLRQP